MPQDVILRLNYRRILVGLSHSSKFFSKKNVSCESKVYLSLLFRILSNRFCRTQHYSAHLSSFFMQRRHPSGQYWKYSVIGFGLSTHEIFITVIKACQLIHFTSSLAPGSPFYCTQFHLTRLRCFLMLREQEQEHPLFW